MTDPPTYTHVYCWCNDDRVMDLTIESEHADKVEAMAAMMAAMAEMIQHRPEEN